MDSHLNGVVICIAGKLSRDAEHAQWTEENIKRWLEARGGKLVDVMSDSVTHLLCSVSAFNAKKDKVKHAQRIKCKIVTYEWLEDAILLHDQFKRKAPTGLYDPGLPRPEKQILALYRKKNSKVIDKKEKADTGVSSPSNEKGDGNTTETKSEDPVALEKTHPSNAAENAMRDDRKPTENKRRILDQPKPKTPKDTIRPLAGIPIPGINLEFYQIYRDPMDGFPFKVEVACPDGRGSPRGKRWVLQLFESKAAPKLYRFGPVYFGKEGDRYRLGRGSSADRPKELAMMEFKHFFFKKTGIKWEERLLKASERQRGYVFRYHLPAPGEPVGYIPSKYMPGKSEGTQTREQCDSRIPACDTRESVSSRKRKRDDTAGPQLVEAAARTSHKKTAAFDDVRTFTNAHP